LSWQLWRITRNNSELNPYLKFAHERQGYYEEAGGPAKKASAAVALIISKERGGISRR
jgi:hypothetical protein